jgi:hypothetical protein
MHLIAYLKVACKPLYEVKILTDPNFLKVSCPKFHEILSWSKLQEVNAVTGGQIYKQMYTFGP